MFRLTGGPALLTLHRTLPLPLRLRWRLLSNPALMPVVPRTRTLRRKGVNHVHNLAAVGRGRG
jgi:hypothetical protein